MNTRFAPFAAIVVGVLIVAASALVGIGAGAATAADGVPCVDVVSAKCDADDASPAPPVPVDTPAELATPEPDVELVDINTYDPAVDDDLFTLYTMTEDLCANALDMAADGIPDDDIIDEGVDVLAVDPETRIVDTVEAAYYLRGILVGCLAAS